MNFDQVGSREVVTPHCRGIAWREERAEMGIKGTMEGILFLSSNEKNKRWT